MPSDFYSIGQLDFVPVKINLTPEGNALYEYLKDTPCALVWYQVNDPGRSRPKKFFRSAVGGRVSETDVDWTKPGVLVTMREALDLCRQHAGVLGVAFVMSSGLNLSCLDIDADNAANADEYVAWMRDGYYEPTSNNGWHYLCIGRLGRNITKPIEFYSGDHLLTASFMGSGPLRRNDDALDFFDSISIKYDIALYEPVLTRDDRSVAEIFAQVQAKEPDVFQRLYMTLHPPAGTVGYDASAMDMALIMNLMHYTRDIDLVYQCFLNTGFGQRLTNRQPHDKRKGKNYLINSIRRALPRISTFWLTDDFIRANPHMFTDPNFWTGTKYAAITPIPDYAEQVPAPTVETVQQFHVPTVTEVAHDDDSGPLYPDLPRGGLFERLERAMFDSYFVENRHFAKMHAIDAVNSLLMPFFIFNNRTRSNMYKIVTGPTSSGKGMILQSSQYLRMANEIVDDNMRGHKQPFIDASTSPLRMRWVTGPMQGSVRGLDKLYAQAYKRRPVIAIKERDFTQSLAGFFSDVAAATGPARNLAELGDECTDLFDLSLPGRTLETKATGKTDAIVIPEPMVDITFEGTQEPLLQAISPDGSNLASGRVNRWIFFIYDEFYATRQRSMGEMRDFPVQEIMRRDITPILLHLNNVTEFTEAPINSPLTKEVDAFELEAFERVYKTRHLADRPGGARDTYARIRMNAQKFAMLLAMERYASGNDSRFLVRPDDLDLAYKFLLPGYDFVARNFEAGNVGSDEDRDFIYNGAMLIRAALKEFYSSREYGHWLATLGNSSQAERFRSLGIVPFKPVRERLWTHGIFNSRRARTNKAMAFNQCLEWLEEQEYIIVDRGSRERNPVHVGVLQASGFRAMGEPITSRVLIRVFR